jgi:FkbM family methyltransferase
MQAIPIPPLFDCSRYVVHDTSAETAYAGDGLMVSSRAETWSYVVACPLIEPSDKTDLGKVFGWLIRVDATLVSGSARLACVAADRSRVASETPLRPGRRPADLVVGELADAAWLILRRGPDSAAESTVVSLHGVESFALVETETTSLAPAAERLTAVPHWSRFYGSPEGDLTAMVRYVQFTRFREPRYTPWLEDLEVLIAPREQMSQAVYVSGEYEPCTSLVLQRLLRAGDTFVDVGANVGWFSMLASRWVGSQGHVLSVEPSQRECERLREHIAHNHLTNVRVLQIAAGREEGEAVLHVADERHSGLNTLKPTFMYKDVLESYTERVRVVTLDRLVECEDLSNVHVIKIDVEGTEYDALIGAQKIMERHKPAIILEVAGEAASAGHAGRQAIEGLLRSFGYVFAAIDADALAVSRVDDMTGAMENFVAAMPAVVSQLVARAHLDQ